MLHGPMRQAGAGTRRDTGLARAPIPVDHRAAERAALRGPPEEGTLWFAKKRLGGRVWGNRVGQAPSWGCKGLHGEQGTCVAREDLCESNMDALTRNQRGTMHAVVLTKCCSLNEAMGGRDHGPKVF